MKKANITKLAICLGPPAGLGGALGAAPVVTKSDAIVSEYFTNSYEVEASEEVLALLESQGIDVHDADVSKAIDGLRLIDYENDDDPLANIADGYALPDAVWLKPCQRN